MLNGIKKIIWELVIVNGNNLRFFGKNILWEKNFLFLIKEKVYFKSVFIVISLIYF